MKAYKVYGNLLPLPDNNRSGQRLPGLTILSTPVLRLRQRQVLLLFLFQRLNTLRQGVHTTAAKRRVQRGQQDLLLPDRLPQVCHSAYQTQNQNPRKNRPYL